MDSPQNKLLSYLLPRLQDVLFVALFVGVIGLGARLLNVDGDLGRHLTVGHYILRNRSIPTRDIFSHTMDGQPLTPHEWLAEVVYALAYQVGGLDGVVWLCALLIALTFTLCYRQCYAHSQSVLLSLAWAILGAAAASLHWLARPHLFTLLLVILWISKMECLRQGNLRQWWVFPLLMLFWANLHGAFIAGFVIWGLYWVGAVIEKRWKQRKSRSREYLFIGAISFLATLLNPSGWHLWATSLGYVRNRYLVGHTAEYLPPNFHDPSTWPFLGMIVLSLMLALASRSYALENEKPRIPMAWILLLAAWTAMGLYSVRNIPIYVLIAAPMLAGLTHDFLRRGWVAASPGESPPTASGPAERFTRLDGRLSEVESVLRGHLWPALTVLLIALAFSAGMRLDFDGRGNHFDLAVFPVAALDWLETRSPPGEVFNYFPWGGYLLHRDWPERRVFIDGQTDFYGEALTRQYEQVITLDDGWQDVLREYRVGWVLMPPKSLLARALLADPTWHLLYRDETAVILSREP